MDGLDRYLREAEVLRVTSLSHATLWREVKAKRFPAQVRISPGRIGWRASEIACWQADPMHWQLKSAA
ncbi:AlpA family phage regulatory protein [Pseudomonas sp. P5_152]|uniref:helix-turn-helix transcriptional regulator n=1 Tax=Pseudomonas sp. P5_152 TaxID=3043442 RepID=UPI002A35F067|nr:AlpA family phage regulatory protein [Pseudomonas sp. P5_152]MDX9664254.1 AlpA family phage regulatory protein [Pseudomonas sp. P5_152]